VTSDLRWLSLLALLVHGCGASTATTRIVEEGEAEDLGDQELPQVPIELSIHVPYADFIEVGELRGRPGLIFVFTTWDGVSQAMLTPLSLVVEAHPECFFVGVAVQPDARSLVDAWAYALEPPFPVGWEPRDTLSGERSPLGHLDAVPMIVTVDASGRPGEKATGLLQASEVDAMLRRAIERGRATPAR